MAPADPPRGDKVGFLLRLGDLSEPLDCGNEDETSSLLRIEGLEFLRVKIPIVIYSFGFFFGFFSLALVLVLPDGGILDAVRRNGRFRGKEKGLSQTME